MTMTAPTSTAPTPPTPSRTASGGAVTAEMLAIAFLQGAQLATLLICVGAANSLASPVRLLKALPPGLYHVGVAGVVALSLAPRIMVNVRRVMQARRMRGRPTRGLRAAAVSDAQYSRAAVGAEQLEQIAQRDKFQATG